MTLKTLKDVTDIAVSWITVLGLAAGGIFALVEYQGHLSDARTERTLALVSRFNEPGALSLRLKLDMTWQRHADEIKEVLTRTDGPQAEIDARYRAYVIGFVTKNELQDALLAVINVLEQAAVCVNENLCDRTLVRTFFESQGRSVFRSYYPYLCELRTTWRDPSIAGTLEAFYNPISVGRACSDDAPTLRATPSDHSLSRATPAE